MTPTRRPVLFMLAGSVLGAACATLVYVGTSRTPSEPEFAEPGLSRIETLVSQVSAASINGADSGQVSHAPLSRGGFSVEGDWMDLDAFGHIPPSFAARAALTTWNASFGPTPSETVLGGAPVDGEDEAETAQDTQDAPDAQTPGTVASSTEPTLRAGDLVDVSLTISSGETFMGLLLDQEIPRQTALGIVDALKKTFDPRSLRAGQDMMMTFVVSDEGDLTFQNLSFEPTVGETISLTRADDGTFSSSKQAVETVRHIVRYDGVITSSLFEAAVQAGAPQKVLADMIRVFSYDVDFQRDIRQNDSFEIFYEQMDTKDGRTVRTGDLLYASLTLSGKKYQLYRYENADGGVDYYNERGEGVRKALLRTPINGARLTSSFGMRRHPILGYSKMHKGVDFAAPPGTPIYAAGDGVIAKAEFGRGYGNHVRIRHDSEFQTVYAHMRNIAQGIKPGTRVKQGQVIGYVGSTGMSTGPHLHYEIVRNGSHVNPQSTRFAASSNLKGKELAEFQRQRDRTYAAFEATPSGTKLASAK
ncbi:peptidoglycan DD-metalloendopeptidase family protein [Phaeovibrio sulfidiphilus]|uniref:Peptidoglycan DD-metalloendopeptidase family protein n=1 Tax=Phaeovibrio sulfidiphilus TaxID=1220600 RepID=A0A8J6YY23_9PROT|nr:peptidoglycan DD-metalloendopeptidase family protein [Phaeovibrio sulfidiphilus]MBE1236638.1 peptidoglycan DD-metalloendopeptidase family protein [Phaeovibrio sulfidiphilus]